MIRLPSNTSHRIVAILCLVGAITACGGGGKTDGGQTATPTPVTPSVTVVKGTA